MTMSSSMYAKYMVGALVIFSTFTTGVVFLIRDLTLISGVRDEDSMENNGTNANTTSDNLEGGDDPDKQNPQGMQLLSLEAVALLASALAAVVLFTAYVVDGIKGDKKKKKKKSSRDNPKSTSSLSTASSLSPPRKGKVARTSAHPQDVLFGETRMQSLSSGHGEYTQAFYNCTQNEMGVMVEVPIGKTIPFSCFKSSLKFTLNFSVSPLAPNCTNSTFVDSYLRNMGSRVMIYGRRKEEIPASLVRVNTENIEGLYTEYACKLEESGIPEVFYELNMSPSTKTGSASGWDDFFRSDQYVQSSKELWIDATVGCEQCGNSCVASASFKCFRPRELSQNERESNIRKRIYGGHTFITKEGVRYIQDRKMNHVSKFLEAEMKEHMKVHHLKGKAPSSSKGLKFSEDRFLELIVSSNGAFVMGPSDTHRRKGKKSKSRSPNSQGKSYQEYPSPHSLSPGQVSDEDSNSVWQGFSAHSTPTDYHSTPSPNDFYENEVGRNVHSKYDSDLPLTDADLDLLLPLPDSSLPQSHDHFLDIDLSFDDLDSYHDNLN